MTRRRVPPVRTSGDVGATALTNRGYHARGGVIVCDKLEPLAPDDFGVLEGLGGRRLRADTWEHLGDMVREKELIERRIILPLARPELVRRSRVCPE